MNILIAADSFKGSCSARQVTDTIERAAKNVIPDVTITKIPVADGGEGTVDALVAAMKGTKVSVPAFKGSLCGSAAFWLREDRASYSPRIPITGFPVP